MGGQQFCSAALSHGRTLDDVVSFDRDMGTILVQAGIEWPALIEYLGERPGTGGVPWAIRQKQTGCRPSLDRRRARRERARAGDSRFRRSSRTSSRSRSSTPHGELVGCSRDENAELFALVAGGYGLFRVRRRRDDATRPSPNAGARRRGPADRRPDAMFDSRIADGFLYGDFQFATDPASATSSGVGVFSCYRPVEHDGPLPSRQRRSRATTGGG